MIAFVARAVAIGGIGLHVAVGQAAAVVLVTPGEAALPDAIGVTLELGMRGVTRGPRVRVVSPAPTAGAVRSPLNLVLKFESHGGATIDPDSVKITYLKRPMINLTQRVTDFVKPSGIELDTAEMPPGTHYIRVEISDDAGRIGSAAFAITVWEPVLD